MQEKASRSRRSLRMDNEDSQQEEDLDWIPTPQLQEEDTQLLATGTGISPESKEKASRSRRSLRMDNEDSQQEEDQDWIPTPQLQEEDTHLLATGTRISPEFKSEPFSVQKNTFEKGLVLPRVEVRLFDFRLSKRNLSDLKHKQKKRSLSTTRERVTKRHRPEETEQEETNALSHLSILCTSQTGEDDFNYMCPLDSDEATDSENDDNRDDLQKPTTSDIHSDPESSCVDTHETFITTTGVSTCVPTSQLDHRGLCVGKEKSEVPMPCLYVPFKFDMEEKEMETESNMWKLRANRVQQIIFSQGKRYWTFQKSKKFGLEYNVGFGPKQNLSVDSLTTYVLLEIAKFALAMNSSEEDFIMEILEYNFDFGHCCEDHKKSFTSELMNRVRKLKNCEDAVKLSKEAFELPDFVSSVNMANQSMASVKPEFSCMSTATESDVLPTCSSDPHDETKEHRVDLYPFCKDIGLKLNVISSQENKKLDINKLTNGAMTEVTNFAEKLCGTFDQICQDILRHNFDLDCQNEDADLCKTILTRIPIIVEHQNLSNLKGFQTLKNTFVDFSSLVMDYKECPNSNTCSTASSEDPIIDRNVGSSTESNHQNELKLLMWKLRSNQIKEILSVPHMEHCPLYSYSRCKKTGIDFNVGSGVKQNFDASKFLTNGIMVEINTLAAALVSSQKEFITEILEYNFHLKFNNEFSRSVFAKETETRCFPYIKTAKPRILKKPFELPDSRVIDESAYPWVRFCPKCYQDRNVKLCQDESDLDHVHHPGPHYSTDTDSAEANSLAQKPEKDLSAAYQAAEKTIMDSYPLCKKIGLSLCVDRDKPKIKLDTCTLTRGVMKEIFHFAKKLCGTINKLTNDVLEHNFNFGTLQSQRFYPSEEFNLSASRQYNEGRTWFNDIFVVFPRPHKDSTDVVKQKVISTTEQNEKKETTKKRILTLQKQKEEAAMLSKSTADVKASLTSCLGNRQLDVSSSLHIADSNETEEKTENRQNVSYKFDMEEGEMETESNMWKLRANRVQQILFSLDEYSFCFSKRFGLEHNVGFGPKQNFDVHSCHNAMLIEIAKFALAMNSSQEEFIMEILEYNFDFGHWSIDQRKVFASELMERVRWLKKCEDPVKLSKEVFELPDFVSSVNMANQSMASVNPEVSSTSSPTESDVVPTCSSGPHDETKEHRVDLYPFCKDIGLKLNVISSQENKKLDINKLTNGAMTEVTNFAEKLCGTFDQICLDILRHNFDLDQPNGDSDLARTILAQIPVILEHKRLRTLVLTYKSQYTIKDIPDEDMDCQMKSNLESHSILNLSGSKEMKNSPEDLLMMKEDCQNNSTLDTCSTGFSQAPIKSQTGGSSTQIGFSTGSIQAPVTTPNVGSSAGTEIDKTNLLLWTLRQTQIQQILSVPHVEHCPLYSYSRCKKLGIDFNVGSGIKQNLDPSKCLTNGIMLEIGTLAAALGSAQKELVTEILEYNFDLHLNDEVSRSVFTQNIEIGRSVLLRSRKRDLENQPVQFTLKSSESSYPKHKYCAKCYQDRNSKLVQHPSDPVNEFHHHPQSMTDTVLAEGNCSAQKSTKDLFPVFQAEEEKIMNSNPHCKKIGLSLCVNKDKPKSKLDPHLLTWGVMREIASFTKQLCGTRRKVFNDVLEHNFNFAIFQRQNLNHASMFHKAVTLRYNKGPTWFNDIFDIFSWPYGYPTDIAKQSDICTATPEKKKQSTETQKQVLHTEKKERSEKDLLLMMKDCQNNPTLDACSTDFSQAPIKSQTGGNSTQIDFLWPQRDSTNVVQQSEICTAEQNEKRGTTQTQKLPLFTKEGRKEEAAMLTCLNKAPISRTIKLSDAQLFPLCSKIGLDLDVTSKSGKKQKLDLKLLTRAVVIEIHKFLSKKPRHYYPGSLYDILDYNFDISSQNYRRWEFSIAAASQVKIIAKNPRYHLHKANKVFKLPFVFEKKPRNESVQERQNRKNAKLHVERAQKKKNAKGKSAQKLKHRSDARHACFVDVQTNMKVEDKAYDLQVQERQNKKTGESHQKKTVAQQLRSRSPDSHDDVLDVNTWMRLWLNHPGTIMQETQSPGRHVCDGPLQEVIQIKEEDDSLYGVVKPEPVTSPEADVTAQQLKCFPHITNASLVDVQSNTEVWFHQEDMKCDKYPDIIKQQTGSPETKSGVCDGPLREINQPDLKLKQEKKSFSTTHECGTKRHRPEESEQEEINALSHPSNVCTSQTAEGDFNYTCPLDSDETTDSQNDDNRDGIQTSNSTCSTGFSQAPIKTQNIRSSTDIEQDNELDLLLWTLRQTQIQQILTVPHGEHCPLSYSRCKKLGIDVNVGSGIKQNLDPSKFLTNGIIVEINTLATALHSAQKEFITEILENNFHLNFNNDVCRSVFAQRVLYKINVCAHKVRKDSSLKMPFELPDTSSIDQSTSVKGKYCPKCQDTNSALFHNVSEPVNELRHDPQSMTDTFLAEANSSAQKSTKDLSTAFQAAEERIMNSYPHCKKIGLSLCVNKDKPKGKLDLHVLTRGVMREITFFAKRLCGKTSKYQLMKDVLEHNFNIDIRLKDLHKVELINKDPTCFNDIFVIEPHPYKSHKDVTKWKENSAIQKNERKEMTKKRRLALLTKREEATMLNKYTGSVKAKKCKQSSGYYYPISKGMGLDLDLENPTSTDTHSETELSCLGNQSFLSTTDGLSTLPIVKFNMDPSFVTQSNERELFGTEEKTEIQENVSYKFDMEEEEMETESNMWKLRTDRVQEILFSVDKYRTFRKAGGIKIPRRLGLEYNIGFGPKQNLSANLLNTSVLYEIAKFALAMNSSQEDFIMEILEYNFDFGRWSEDQRKSFASELMNRVRKLKNCEDAVKLSKEAFELPDFVSSVNMANQSMSIVKPEFNCTSSPTESDVAPTCSSDPHDETKEHRVDLYPFCKDIGLKLNVISSQENKKLDINKLTNGAMTEVTNFAEKLCGTFDQICQDILRHNFDLDQPNGDFDLARSIVAQIPVFMEHTRLAAFLKRKVVVDVSAMAMSCWKNPDLDAQNRLNPSSSKEIKHTIQDLPAMKKDCQNNSNLDECSTGFSQAPITSPNAGCSTDIEQDNVPNLLLWTLRETQIQQILSVPHVEHCPFYSYSRCKKLGIDFNVASAIKQNFDPSKFLTNGILLEINTLAEALRSSHKEFITEILEYNFHLDFKSEVCRSVFAHHMFVKAKITAHNPKIRTYLNMPFELPDTRSMDQSVLPKSIYCPKCYQDRNSKLVQDPSEPVNELHHHSYAMTDQVFSEAKSSAQKSTKDLSSAFQAEEEKIMNSNPHCKKIGLSLCVNKDKPKVKLDLQLLTQGVMKEVFYFAKKLSGEKIQPMRDVLEHNFNINIQSLNLYHPLEVLRSMALLHNGPTWFNDLVLIQSKRVPRDKRKDDSAVQKYERKETLKKRKLALLTKKEKAAKMTDLSAAVKVRTCQLISAEAFPLCSKIGLDLDVTSKSEKKEKLDLKLLTTAVVMEIDKFLIRKKSHYYPGTLYDILDYNFDISSQNHRCWEFSIAAASQVKLVAKTYQKNLHIANDVFKLPFGFEEAEKTKNQEDKTAQKLKHRSDARRAYFVDLRTKKTGESHEKKTVAQQLNSCSPDSHDDVLDVNKWMRLWLNYPGTVMQEAQSPGRHVCDGSLQEVIQIKEEDDSHYGVVKPEPVTSPQADVTAQQLKCFPDVTNASLVDVQNNKEVWFHQEDIKSDAYPDTIKQHTGSPVTMSGVCDGPLQDVQIKEDEDESYHVVVKPEPVTVDISNLLTMCPPSESKEETQYYSLAGPPVPEGYGVLAVCPNTESSVKTESDTEEV